MLGKEDALVGVGEGGGNGGSRGPHQLPGNRKSYWRSASWSSSRSTLPPVDPDCGKDVINPSGNNVQCNRRFPVPLTPRSSNKARSFLPPLQPLAIARRSLEEWPKAGSDDIGEWAVPSTPGGNNNKERLKIDLSAIQRIPDNNTGLVKREKIAFFDKECSKVAEHIYLGGDAVARDRDILKQHGITHILNCVGFVCPEYFKANFVYRTLWLQDSPSEDITSILYDVFDYFEDVREQHGRVFVHCCQGVSRSTSLVIAYRMWREGQSFDDAFQYVKAARGIADPNMGFACQLLQCQKRVHAFPLSPSSLLRMYRIAPHSPYDPLHLVPKMLNAPSLSALDSRGAFIIHIPSAIYVWVGRKCESFMERDARGAVCQIVRYEKVQLPIEVVQEGEEPSYFWDSFSTLLPLMEKSSDEVDVAGSIKILPGERSVDLYDVDFEIFNKAIVGGFVPPFASSDTEHETHLPARESSWSVLRRKFAVGCMKEFVSTSQLAPSRVYPDSELSGVDEKKSLANPKLLTANSLSSSRSLSPPSFSSPSSSLPSALSSPPYLSPDSLSSDSCIGSKHLSVSPVLSPSAVSSSNSFSSTPSPLPNLSFLSTKLSPHSISKTSEFIDVNFTSSTCSSSVSSPSKKSLLSIAERRGSTPKPLKLPMLPDGSQEKIAPPSCPASVQGGIRINEQPSSIENMYGNLKYGQIQEHSLQGSLCAVNCHRLTGEGAFDQSTDAQGASSASRTRESYHLTGVSGGDSLCSNIKQDSLIVFEWPTLEKVPCFEADNLDSNCVFIFVAPISGNYVNRTLYIWVGKSSEYGNNMLLETSKGLDGRREISWKTVGDGVLSRLGLPEDTHVEIVKEDEESSEFLMLSSLQH